jgi:hypothetical protein
VVWVCRKLVSLQKLSSQNLRSAGQSTLASQPPSTSPLNHPDRNVHEFAVNMSYYFAIIGTQDNPLFEYEFGTAKQGGDGIARFPEQARHMNQFIVHSSLDIVEEVQWGNGQMCFPLFPCQEVFLTCCRYLKCIDRFYNNYVSCWMTGGSKLPSTSSSCKTDHMKMSNSCSFMRPPSLLHRPRPALAHL